MADINKTIDRSMAISRSVAGTLSRRVKDAYSTYGESVRKAQSDYVQSGFPGANPHPTIEPFERLDTRVSYFLGSDPAGWRPDVPAWGGVRYRELYPGIDLELSAARRGWSWRLVRDRPSAAGDPHVTLRVEGADAGALRTAVDQLKGRPGSAVILPAAGSVGRAAAVRVLPTATRM